MAHMIIMPKLGQTVEESTIVKWHKKIGDSVSKGDILFEIETDKAVLEVESFFEGTLLAVIVPEGQTVPVTAPVAFVGTPGEKIPDVPAAVSAKPKAEARQAPKPQPDFKTPPPRFAAEEVVSPPAVSEMELPPPRHSISPRARKMLQQLPLDDSQIKASGVRVTKQDVLDYLEASGYNKLKITPAALNLALKEKINILKAPLGHDGKIGVDEVQTALKEKPKLLSPMRQVIARRMTQSVTTIPHFFVTVSVDVTDLMTWRKDLKKEGHNYSLNDFVIKAAALVLRDFPVLNSSTDGEFVTWKSRVNVGMAVSVPGGLLVPVIHDADQISLFELHEKITQLAGRARSGKLTPDEMQGGTFTVSNMGMLDVESFTAIINPGEAAILAVSSIISQVVAYKGDMTVRSMMKITLSSDHRIVDGALAARFINKVREKIEDLEAWKNMI